MRQKLRNPELRKDLEIFLLPQRTSVRLKNDNPESAPGLIKRKMLSKIKLGQRYFRHYFSAEKSKKELPYPTWKNAPKLK